MWDDFEDDDFDINRLIQPSPPPVPTNIDSDVQIVDDDLDMETFEPAERSKFLITFYKILFVFVNQTTLQVETQVPKVTALCWLYSFQSAVF